MDRPIKTASVRGVDAQSRTGFLIFERWKSEQGASFVRSLAETFKMDRIGVHIITHNAYVHHTREEHYVGHQEISDSSAVKVDASIKKTKT